MAQGAGSSKATSFFWKLQRKGTWKPSMPAKRMSILEEEARSSEMCSSQLETNRTKTVNLSPKRRQKVASCFWCVRQWTNARKQTSREELMEVLVEALK
ncbi:uncharacterized protein LOC114673536 [Macaca mulatta]